MAKKLNNNVLRSIYKGTFGKYAARSTTFTTNMRGIVDLELPEWLEFVDQRYDGVNVDLGDAVQAEQYGRMVYAYTHQPFAAYPQSWRDRGEAVEMPAWTLYDKNGRTSYHVAYAGPKGGGTGKSIRNGKLVDDPVVYYMPVIRERIKQVNTETGEISWSLGKPLDISYFVHKETNKRRNLKITAENWMTLLCRWVQRNADHTPNPQPVWAVKPKDGLDFSENVREGHWKQAWDEIMGVKHDSNGRWINTYPRKVVDCAYRDDKLVLFRNFDGEVKELNWEIQIPVAHLKDVFAKNITTICDEAPDFPRLTDEQLEAEAAYIMGIVNAEFPEELPEEEAISIGLIQG